MVRKKLILLFAVLVGAAVALITNVRFTPATADGRTPELSMIVIGKLKHIQVFAKYKTGLYIMESGMK